MSRTPQRKTRKRQPAPKQKPKTNSQSGGLLQPLATFGAQHLRALFASLGRLYREPLPSLMTAAVIGIALALPAGFLLMLQNVERLTGGWEGGTQLSLFIEEEIAPQRYQALADELQTQSKIGRVNVVAPDAALEEFRRLSGFDDALDLLDHNPLPAVLVVQPVTGLGPDQIAALAESLRTLPEVNLLRLDQEWVQRLHAIMLLIQRIVWVVAALLALAVMLVVGNTIRLDIENRRDEIVIAKLIGATNGFIRRPFLYEGFWYGAAGGFMAAVLIELGRWFLSGPARELAVSYGSSLLLQGLGLHGFRNLLLAGVILGLLGSWIAVGRHLAAIEPR